MKLDVIRRIDKGDLEKSDDKLPKWIDALLTPLNAFIENVVNALRGRLTFEDNFQCAVVTYDVTSGTDIEVNPTANGNKRLRVTGVIPLAVSDGQIATFGWIQKENGNILISMTLVSATTVRLKLLILLG